MFGIWKYYLTHQPLNCSMQDVWQGAPFVPHFFEFQQMVRVSK